MTKRFHYHIDEVGIYYYVCDNTKKGDDKIIFEFDSKFDAMEVCKLLNELYEENIELQKTVNKQHKQLNARGMIIMNLKLRIRELERMVE